jgi:hypothetical protein
MMPESRSISVLGNDFVNTFPQKRSRAKIEERRSLWVRAKLVATQLCGKDISEAVNQHATIEEAVFSVGPPRGYKTRTSRSWN